MARAYALDLANGAKATLNALESVVESLSGVEGRKALLYVSDGMPMHPGEDAFRLLFEMCGGEQPLFKTEDLASRFRKVTRLANANGVTFYTLETAGVRNFSNASAEEGPAAGDLGPRHRQYGLREDRRRAAGPLQPGDRDRRARGAQLQ